MKPTFSFYTPADFGRVYHFLRTSSDNDFLPYERVRFQFCLGLHIDGLEGGFERTCGIWQDSSGIVALALTEGGTRWGETFFVFRREADKTPELLGRMCDFAERFTSKISDDRKSNSYSLEISDNDQVLIQFLSAREYKKTGDAGRALVKAYSPEPENVHLPDGFVIKDARTVSPFYQTLAHIHSFRYNQENDGREREFAKLRTMPDYRPELDLILFDKENQPAGLACFWVSEKSKTAVLEPLGTVWWYRRMGLGEALITEGINRTRTYGCNALLPAGGSGPFYEKMGFVPQGDTYSTWGWTSN